jgi:hypothetical protein
VPQVIIKGKRFGYYEIKNQILFYHTFKTPQHFFRKFNGFGISWAVLCYLQAIMNKRKCIRGFVIIHYKTDDVVKKYIANISDFFKSEKIYTDDTMFLGDYQKFLSLEEMRELKEGENEWKDFQF